VFIARIAVADIGVTRPSCPFVRTPAMTLASCARNDM
jgi:hypothetical protein